MSNHPNRGWRSRWRVDLNTGTATHRDGWVYQFALDADDPDEDLPQGECIRQPENLTLDQMANAHRISGEAGAIYMEALQTRH